MAAELLADGYTVAKAANVLTVQLKREITWNMIRRIADSLRKQGIPVMRAPQGKRPRVAA